MRWSNRNGFTFAELLVSVAIFVTVGTVMTQQLTLLKNAMANVRIKQQVSDLRESMSRQVNCSQTLKYFTASDGSVNCNGAVELRNFQGNPLPPEMGDWQFESSCSNSGIIVNVMNSRHVKDPLSKQYLDYNNKNLNPLFGRGSAYGLCDNSFKNNKRVVVFSARQSEIDFTSGDCAVIFTPAVVPNPVPSSEVDFKTITANFTAPFEKATILDARCSEYCKRSTSPGAV